MHAATRSNCRLSSLVALVAFRNRPPHVRWAWRRMVVEHSCIVAHVVTELSLLKSCAQRSLRVGGQRIGPRAVSEAKGLGGGWGSDRASLATPPRLLPAERLAGCWHAVGARAEDALRSASRPGEYNCALFPKVGFTQHGLCRKHSAAYSRSNWPS